jgi:hypothetical protein
MPRYRPTKQSTFRCQIEKDDRGKFKLEFIVQLQAIGTIEK